MKKICKSRFYQLLRYAFKNDLSLDCECDVEDCCSVPTHYDVNEICDWQEEIEKLKLENEKLLSTVTELTKKIELLEESDLKLVFIEGAGVDNWSGYSYAIEEYETETGKKW